MRRRTLLTLIVLITASLAAAPIAALLAQSSALALNVGAVNAVMWGDTLIYVARDHVGMIDVHTHRTVKVIGFNSGGDAYLQLFPVTSPSIAFAWSPRTGEEMLFDTSKVLYDYVMGFGRLVAAIYSYGYIYSLIDTATGRELWIRFVPTGEWFYIASKRVRLANAELLSLGSVLSMAPASTYTSIYVLIRPILPPGTLGIATLLVSVVNASTGYAIKNGEVVVYIPRYNFTTPSYKIVRGMARVLIPAPVTRVRIYVRAENKSWYYTDELLYARPGAIESLTVLYPSGKAGSPPRTYSIYLAKIVGSVIKWQVTLPPTATEILAATNTTAVVYEGGTTIAFVTKSGGVYMDTLDFPPIAACASPNGRYIAVLSSAGTLYIYRLTQAVIRAATISVGTVPAPRIPWLGPLACGDRLVAVATGKGIQAISLQTMKEVFRYIYPYLNLSASRVSIAVKPDGDQIVVVSHGTVIVMPPASWTKPFNALAMLPAKVTIRVVNAWGRPVAGATVYVDGMRVCTTNGVGECTTSISYGRHVIHVVPPPRDLLDKATTKNVSIRRSGAITVKLVKNAFNLRLILEDPVSIILRQPVNLTITGVVTKSVVLQNRREAQFLLPKGNYTIVIKPASRPAIYVPESLNISLARDTNITVVLKLAKYPVRVMCIDSETGRKIPCVAVSSGQKGTVLNLTVGKHEITIYPLPSYDGKMLYAMKKLDIEVKGPETLKVRVKRVYAVVNLSLIDEMTRRCPSQALKVFIGAEEVEIRCNKTILVSTGRVVLRVQPTDIYGSVVKRLNIESNENITITVPRRTYSVQINVESSIGKPVAGAVVRLVCQTNPRYSYVLVTGSDGSTSASLPECVYSVYISGPNIAPAQYVLDPATSPVETFKVALNLRGLIMTYIKPIIVISSVVAVSISMMVFITRRLKRGIEEKFAAPKEEEATALETEVPLDYLDELAERREREERGESNGG